MTKYVLLTCTLLVILSLPLGCPWTAQGQDVPALSTLEISLWPEFDQPEVLVIYRGLFGDDVSPPSPVEIYLPARVGQPTAVAYVGEDGQRFNQQYTTRLEGDWLVVSFELATLGFQLEYYDTLPVDSTGKREYAFVYVADYPVADLKLDFQVPPTAEAFALDPAADSVIQEADGLTYHLVQAGSLEQGEEQSWTFSYQKDNPDLTVSALVSPETPVPAAPSDVSGGDDSTVWIFLIAFVALVAVGAGAFWLGRRTQSEPEAAPLPPKQRKRRGSGRGAKAQPRDATLFCYTCGAQLRPDSEFCHKCGAAVRRD